MTVTNSITDEWDFGDVPRPYPTLLAEEGARHLVIGPTLGPNRDSEADGSHSDNANSDDVTGTPSDEDGGTFGTIQVGQLDASVHVNVQNAPMGAKLDAWIDFNKDGSWSDPFEHIANSVAVTNGDNTITFDVPSWSENGTTYARFRVSTSGELGVGGIASDGEVEDYRVTIQTPWPIGDVSWRENPISVATTTPSHGANSVSAADMDADGDMDLLSAFYLDERIVWYENDGSERFTAHTIATAGGSFVQAADVDGDGDTDVLSASFVNDMIAWYENDGSGEFTAHTISSSADGARSVFAADVDADGDLDVLSASYHDDTIAWYENDGDGTFTAHAIASSANVPLSVSAADVDGDGDLDVLSASFGNVKVAWYENLATRSNGALGVSENGAWSLDGNRSLNRDPEERNVWSFEEESGAAPMVGDWNANDVNDIGVYTAGYGLREVNGSRTWNHTDLVSLAVIGSAEHAPIFGDRPTAISKSVPLQLNLPGIPSQASTDGLSHEVLESIVEAAITVWVDAGISREDVERLRGVTISMANLSGSYLAVTSSAGIVIDVDLIDAAFASDWYDYLLQ